MRKSSPTLTTLQPCHFGSGRPRPSRSRLADRNFIDGNCEPVSADGLPWQPQDPLEHRHADRQIAIQVEKRRKRLRRLNGEQLGEMEALLRSYAIEPIGTLADAFQM